MKKEYFTSKYILESGVPCVKHRCILCCVKTEMPLSCSDIDRVTQLGYRINVFAVKSRGEWQLKNRNGRCVFLSSNRCIIYAHRPLGCQLYPLVFDEESGKYVKDTLCPYREEFKVTKNDEKKITILLHRLKRKTIQ